MRFVRPKPGTSATAPARGGVTLGAERDHVLAQDRGSGAGSADGDAAGVCATDRLGDRRSTEDRGEAELIAAGDEDAVGLVDVVEPLAFFGVVTRLEVQRLHLVGAELAKQLFVALARVFELRSGGDHDDARTLSARHVDEAAQDDGGALFVLGAADRDDIAAFLVRFDLRGTHDFDSNVPTMVGAPERTTKRPLAITSRI